MSPTQTQAKSATRTSMLELLRKIYGFRWAPVSEETDWGNAVLCQELPFQVHEYPSGLEFNGWVVPQKWKPVKAEIWKDGELIYDGMQSPLGVVGYADSFNGKVSGRELKEHLCYHPNFPNALIYHCDYYYKPWRRTWGMSVTHNFFKTIEDDAEYEVNLQTVFEDGTLKVLDYYLPGESEETIILNSHNCHTGQANDDIAGVVVGVEVLRRLAEKPKRRYSYRLIVTAEHIGTVFYLHSLTPEQIGKFKYGMFLEMLGNKNRFAFQESFTGTSDLDRAVHNYMRYHHADYHSDRFRKIIGNDETVWEAPGYEIPCISLSRWPYLEYHSSMDTDDIIHEEMLEEATNAVLGYLEILETNAVMHRHFDGLVCLSNPKYDLYVSPGDPSINPMVPEEQHRWNYLMNCITRHFDGRTTILDIAEKYDQNYFNVLEYVRKFEEKGLVTIEPALPPREASR